MAGGDLASADQAQLEHMGHKGELKRQFSPLFVTVCPILGVTVAKVYICMC